MDTLNPEGLHARYVNTLAGTPASASYQIIRDNRAYGRTLLTLRILVQNRRKDKSSILVFGARAQLLSKVSSTDAVQRGRTDADNMVVFTKDGRVLPPMTWAIDVVADMIRVQQNSPSGTWCRQRPMDQEAQAAHHSVQHVRGR